MGKRSRDKGLRFEREIVNAFQAHGIAAERVPLSGSAGGSYVGDISFPVMGEDKTLEAKKRADGFKELYAWIEGHYGVVIARDRSTPLVAVRFDDFAELLRAAERRT